MSVVMTVRRDRFEDAEYPIDRGSFLLYLEASLNPRPGPEEVVVWSSREVSVDGHPYYVIDARREARR